MNHHGPDHPASYYAASMPNAAARPTLKGEVETTVCVIGGGFTGLNAALRAAELGLPTILLEGSRIGWGASGRNGGQVITGQRQDQTVLEKDIGAGPATALWQLAEEAKARVKALIAEHNIDADLQAGHLTAAWKPAHAEDLRQYTEHMATTYNYPHGRFVQKAEMEQYVASSRYYGGMYDADGAHLHPLKFVAGLARAAETKGAQLYEDSAALSLEKGHDLIVKTAHGTVRSKFLVLGGNAYLGGLEPMLEPYILPINNYLIATELLGHAHAKSLIPSGAAISDTKFVLDYYRMSADGRLIFGGGETYGNREPNDIKEFVRPCVERVFPQLRGVKIDYGWGGALAITLPRMPHVGRIDRNIYFAQGYSGQGIGIASQMGALMADAIYGQSAKFDVYGALKIPQLPGGALLRRPLLTAAMLWYGLRDRL